MKKTNQGIAIRSDHIQITVTHNKKRYRKTLRIKPTPANIKYAVRQREAWLHELALGSVPKAFIDEEYVLISSLLTRWLKHKENDVKASTYNDYRKSVTLLSEAFGHINAGKLTIGKIRDYCFKSTAGAKRLNNLLSPMRQALQEAVEDENITKNILTGWTCKKKDLTL